MATNKINIGFYSKMEQFGRREPKHGINHKSCPLSYFRFVSFSFRHLRNCRWIFSLFCGLVQRREQFADWVFRQRNAVVDGLRKRDLFCNQPCTRLVTGNDFEISWPRLVEISLKKANKKHWLRKLHSNNCDRDDDLEKLQIWMKNYLKSGLNVWPLMTCRKIDLYEELMNRDNKTFPIFYRALGAR